MVDVQPPLCTLGYTDAELRGILGERYKSFTFWMEGQTGGWCDGRAASRCGPHGPVVYSHDLRNFLAGGRVVD